MGRFRKIAKIVGVSLLCVVLTWVSLRFAQAVTYTKPKYTAQHWDLVLNATIDDIADDITTLYSQLQALATTVANWTTTVQTPVLIETTPIFVNDHQFTLAGDYTAVLPAGKRLLFDLGQDPAVGNTVLSSSYSSPNTTVTLTYNNLTGNLQAVSYYATRSGLLSYGSGDVITSEYGSPSWANLQAAVAVANASGRRLVITPGTWPVSDDLSVTAPVFGNATGILQPATTKTLALTTFDGTPDQHFDCVGTGAVTLVQMRADPRWWYDGGGDWLDAVNAAIQSLTSGTVNMDVDTTTSGSYVCKSNVNLDGYGTITPTFSTTTPVIDLGSGGNIRISGITISGGGSWTATPFSNPNGGGNSVGFTNGLMGIATSSGASGITVENVKFSGLHKGVYFLGATDSNVITCKFSNIGMSAIDVRDCQDIGLYLNDGNGVHGNMTAGGDISTANSKFADFCYIYRSQRITQIGGIVQDVKRIGTVGEGDAITLNEDIQILGVKYYNMNSCRGTEYNAAVWFEPTKSAPGNLVSGCTMNNYGATAGTNSSYGIVASNLKSEGNTVKYFDYGIVMNDGGSSIKDTIQYNAYYGIYAGNLAVGAEVCINGSEIKNNGVNGIILYRTKGTYRIINNYFKNNGADVTKTASAGYGSALWIDRYYDNQKVIIDNNTFETSANESATTGQIYGIVGRSGGDFNYTTNFVTNNKFLFTGTWTSSFSANMDTAKFPSGFVYDNTVTKYNYEYNIMFHGNFSSKQPRYNFNLGTNISASSTSNAITIPDGYNLIATTLTENITTVTMPQVVATFTRFTWIIKQAAGGGYTVTLPATVLIPGGSYTMTATANKSDMLEFTWDWSKNKWLLRVTQNY